MEDNESIENDSLSDPSTESGGEENPIVAEESASEDGSSVPKNSQQQAKSSNHYLSSLTWNFDTISGVLAIVFVAFGTCTMYFQNSIKLGSHLLWVAVLIGLFHSFVRVYLSELSFGHHDRKGSSDADSSKNPEPEVVSPEPVDSSPSQETESSE